jgi:hypothetical protein
LPLNNETSSSTPSTSLPKQGVHVQKRARDTSEIISESSTKISHSNLDSSLPKKKKRRKAKRSRKTTAQNTNDDHDASNFKSEQVTQQNGMF